MSEQDMRVVESGGVFLVRDHSVTLGIFETHAEAWAFVDRHNDEPNSPIKARYYWSQGKQFYD